MISDEIIRTIQIEADSIHSLLESLDMDQMVKAVHLIGDCNGRIIVAGCGTSAMAAKKIVHSLNCIERPSAFLTPSDAVHGGLGLLQPGDILILISKGGNTRELVQLIPACKTKNAVLIGVTENPDSIIAKEADLFLKVKVESEPCRFNMLATASTMAVISVFDAISIALMQYTNYTKEQFATIHPSGAVGDRLLERSGK
ncbi:MAG TPA: SIS domain-containing protein [Anaerovoracaceae bacterium]|nr:SIS domain-containing protein [Anaerovoracaceae bacterium]